MQRLQMTHILVSTTLFLAAACGTGAGIDPTGDGDGDAEGEDVSSTSEGSSGGETESDTGGSFFPDMGGDGCGAMCDIWSEDDCPSGQKCTAVACEVGSLSWDSNVCRDVQGDKQRGDQCSGAGVDGMDECAAGLLCWDADPETGLGTCVEYCKGSRLAPTCDSPEDICVIVNEGVLPICLPKCDPLSPACPNADNLCLPDPDDKGWACVLDASGELGGYADPCEFANACDLGLLCLDAGVTPDCPAGSLGCCSEICELDQPNTCSGAGGGQECLAFYEEGMEPPGFSNVGVCAIPQ